MQTEENGKPKPQLDAQPGGAEQQYKDLGFGTKISENSKRLINKDGSFNVIKVGGGLGSIHPYQWAISLSWSKFTLLAILFYVVLNALFALLYVMVGIEGLANAPAQNSEGVRQFIENFAHAFYFSVQTFTAVGYGTVSPLNHMTNIVASFEAMIGLVGFALVTGVLFGRFSRPSAKIKFSKKAIVAPYQDINSLQFRIVNRRQNQLTELQVQVALMCYEPKDGVVKQAYYRLELERTQIALFPMTWTIVHPITKDSPLYGTNEADLKRLNAEFLIMLKGYDDTFAQTVHARTSYKYDELVWGAKFVPGFYTNDEGSLIVEVNKVGKCKWAELNEY